MTINRRIEQLEETLNRQGGGICPHLPWKVRTFSETADGAREEISNAVAERYKPGRCGQRCRMRLWAPARRDAPNRKRELVRYGQR